MKNIKSLQFIAAVIFALTLSFSFSCNNPAENVTSLSADTLKLAEIKMQSYIDAGKLSGISILVIKEGETATSIPLGLPTLRMKGC